MTSKRFFKTVQRVNSLIFLAIGLCLLLVVIAALLEMVQDFFRPRTTNPTVLQLDENDSPESELRLGTFKRVPGTSAVWVPATMGISSSSKFGSGTPTELKNFLFFDLETQESSWLLGNHEQVITWHDMPTIGKFDSEAHRAIALLLQIAEEDTNGDGEISSDDELKFYISNPTGTKLTPALADLDHVESFYTHSDDRGFLFYVAAGLLKVAEIDLESLEVVSSKTLPSVSPPVEAP